jgi:hypothetical protein
MERVRGPVSAVALAVLGGCVFEAPEVGPGSDAALPGKDGSFDGATPDGDADLPDAGGRDGGDAGPDAGEADAGEGDAGDAAEADAGEADAAFDAGVPDSGAIVCTPNTDVCDGRFLRTCNATGDGFVPAVDLRCDFTCVNAQCVNASNLLPMVVGACDGAGAVLEPPAGASVTIDGDSITCNPHCGSAAVTSIAAQGVTAQQAGATIAWYCLAGVRIPSGVDVVQDPNRLNPVALIVDGPVSVQGRILFVGGNADPMFAGGRGLGGGTGGPLSSTNGMPGGGPCPGAGATREGLAGNYAAGGGGGGGAGGAGGQGGDGRSADDNDSSAGGAGGGSCVPQDLRPMSGGSGGASGADGSCGVGVDCGWAGGGGGGGLQVSSRIGIEVAGEIDASGGRGYGSSSGGDGAGGGGGGGSGGAILLEAPVVLVTGTLRVEGGDGGPSSAGQGGAGARGGTVDGAPGADFSSAGEGGSGGGGAAGRVRINSANNPGCANAAPQGACSTGGF